MTTMRMMNTFCLKLIIQTMFLMCLVLQADQLVSSKEGVRCIQSERLALLQFKAGIVDEFGMLSSWITEDCCQWYGIGCSNLTGHVLMLDLHGDYSYHYYGFYDSDDGNTFYISGDIHKSLIELQQLKYLNLGGNNFDGNYIPSFFGTLRNLRYLDLSYSNFDGQIPVQFEYLSNLKYLNLSLNHLNGLIPHQLGNLSNLQFLDLSNNDLEGSIPSQLGNLSNLQYLDLHGNYLKGNIPSQLGKLTNLQELYLGDEYRDSALTIENRDHSGGQWLSNLTSLTHLHMLSISNLNKSSSWLQMVGKLPKLRELSLRDCGLSDHFIHSLSQSKFNFSTSLSILDLSYNNFASSLIFQWVSNISSNLVELDLSNNLFEAPPSHGYGTVMNSLQFLDLSNNKLKGVASKSFMNLCALRSLNLFANNFTEDLQTILQNLSSGCVRNSLQELYLSLNGITGILPNLSIFTSLKTLDLSDNKLSGKIPEGSSLPFQLESLSIASNSLEGVIPKLFWMNACKLKSLDLSNNSFSGELQEIIHHLSRCARYSLQQLDLSSNQIAYLDLSQFDLSNNQLSGQIPDCWSNFKSLAYLDLSHNNFSGKIPTSMGSLARLQALMLRNNSLTGEIPFSLMNCTELVMLDLRENRLEGLIPYWIGSELKELQVLSLQKNHFFGSLPLEICYLQKIQLFDLSLNNLSGQISKCIKNFTSMTQKASLDGFTGHSYDIIQGSTRIGDDYELNAFLTWKGVEQLFNNNELFRLKSIDISSNHFSGEIPPEIADLIQLISLNLSRNNFNGKIPSNIGKLTSLDFLDLSRNKLIGLIPSSLSQIDRLGVLDLSHNQLSGEIPTSIQLQSFNASSYEDNLDLCGPPLVKLCAQGEPPHEPKVEIQDDEDLLLNRGFYISLTFGFIIGFWGVFGSILIKRSWRHAYFKFMNNLVDTIYVKWRWGLKG